MDLASWGWTPTFAQHLRQLSDASLRPARVTRRDRKAWLLAAADGEAFARLGRAAREEDPPAVGDWVAVRGPDASGHLVVERTLPRAARFVRQAAGGETRAQVVAANVDVAFLVAALDQPVNARRLERYVALALGGGARPVVVLTKADACADPDAARREAEAVAGGAPVVVASGATGEGVDALRAHLGRGVTGVLLGPSGVGKSTLANRLLGQERLATGAVREDDRKGRHTTTARHLLPLPDDGGLLLDTPGMRELALWGGEEGVAALFDDVEALVASCRFSDCAHRTEPGCAVRAALDAGDLGDDRWRSYQKLAREAARAAERAEGRARVEERRRGRAFGKMARSHVKMKRDRLRGPDW